MTFQTIMKEKRKVLGYTLKDIANKMNVTEATVQRWESGNIKSLRQGRIAQLAEILETTPSVLMGWETETNQDIYNYENVIPVPNMKKVPLLGTIACGEPILAVENIECEVEMPENIRADFALRCRGDSMIDAHIYDGDIVYIRQQPIVDNGEIAVVLIGEEATLKRFYHNGDTVTLMPCNPRYSPFVYTGEELSEIRVLGKAVGFTSTNI